MTQENQANRNEKWATGIMYAHLLTQVSLLLVGIIDTSFRKTLSPLLNLAFAEFPISTFSLLNAVRRDKQLKELNSKK